MFSIRRAPGKLKYLAGTESGMGVWIGDVLPDVPGPCFDVHLVYADALRQAKRVAAFRDFLVRSARDWKY